MLGRRYSTGFTLIELVVAIAILAIIIGIAIPAYTEYVVRTNRTEGKAAILDAAQALERCYSRFNRYNDTANCPPADTLSDGGFTSENGHYVVTSVSLNAANFSLRATPQDAQATRDTRCGNLEITQTGQRSISGTGAIEDCW